MIEEWASEEISDLKNKDLNESNNYAVPMDDKSFYRMGSN